MSKKAFPDLQITPEEEANPVLAYEHAEALSRYQKNTVRLLEKYEYRLRFGTDAEREYCERRLWRLTVRLSEVSHQLDIAMIYIADSRTLASVQERKRLKKLAKSA